MAASPAQNFDRTQDLFLAGQRNTKCDRRVVPLGTIRKVVSDIRAGNCGVLEMAQRIGIWLFWKTRKIFFGAYARGNQKSTPAESLNLRSGEWIEIKPSANIAETLNDKGYNRGLSFTPAMGHSCGEKYRVESKFEKIIVDGTGEMRELRNTAFLEGSMCGCACVAFGGCPPDKYAYWREIWLRRVAPRYR